MFSNKQEAEQFLAKNMMDDLNLGSCPAVPSALGADWFEKFRNVRAKFMESLGDSIPELALLNLSQDDFMGLMTGRALPENLTVKFRRPILYGGEISIGNMFMMPLFPAGFNLDIFMAEQHGQGEIWYPDPAKKVYVSVRMLTGSEGGNATADRLAQGFAAQMSQGREQMNDIVNYIKESGGAMFAPASFRALELANAAFQQMRAAVLPKSAADFYMLYGGAILGDAVVFPMEETPRPARNYAVPSLVKINRDMAGFRTLRGKTIWGRNQIYMFSCDVIGGVYMHDALTLAILRKYNDFGAALADCLLVGKI